MADQGQKTFVLDMANHTFTESAGKRPNRQRYSESDESKKINSELEEYAKKLRDLRNELNALKQLKKDITDTKDWKWWVAEEEKLTNQASELRNHMLKTADELVRVTYNTKNWTEESKKLNAEIKLREALMKSIGADASAIKVLEDDLNRANVVAQYIEENKLKQEEKKLTYIQQHKKEAEELQKQLEEYTDRYDDYLSKEAELTSLIEEQKKLGKDTASLEEQRAIWAAQRAETEVNILKTQQDIEKNKKDKKAAIFESLTSGLGDGGGAGVLKKAITEGIKGADLAVAIGKVVADGIADVAKYSSSAVDDAVNVFINNQAAISARLQGLYIEGQEVSFKNVVDYIDKTVGTNLIISQKQLVADVRKLTDSGIAFNLEQRTILSNLADKMVTTFNVLDASLTRLIRLQQEDITATQLGAEAFLTQLLNSQFQDTSYLEHLYDTVSTALIEANSQMNADTAVAFNSVVQKWLGALYSVGLGESAVSTIAEGVNYLASGNVSALSSNTGLQTLLVSAANLGGLNYADMLNRGASVDETNKLLESVVKYLQSIDDNTGTRVTKSAMASILGITVSDLASVRNIDSSTINYLSGLVSQQNTSSFLGYTNQQLNELTNRITTAEMVNNYLDNVQFSLGAGLASNNESYLNYKATQVITNILGSMTGESGLLSTAIKAIGGLINTTQVLSAAGGFEKINKLAKDAYGEFTRDIEGDEVGLKSLSDIQNMLKLNQQRKLVRGTTSFATPGQLETSYSYSSIANQSFVDANYETLATQAEASAYNMQNIMDGQQTTIKDLNDLYAMLFDQRKAIRISLLDDENTEFFDIIRSIRNQVVDGTVNVDIIDNDVNSVKNAIYSLRSI